MVKVGSSIHESDYLLDQRGSLYDLIQQLIPIDCFSFDSRALLALFEVSGLALLAVGVPAGNVGHWVLQLLAAEVALDVGF